MYLSRLSLQQFRIHATRVLELGSGLTVIVGPNAQGKTSVLEAAQLLATGDSFRAGVIEEMVAFDQELARVTGAVESDDGENWDIEVVLTRGMVQGKRTQSRLFSLNGVRRRKKDVVGHLLVVSFRPEDLRLMEGSPGRRRTFLDIPLSMMHPSYTQSLSVYEEALKKRNKLLTSVREGEMPRTVLQFWNQQLIKHGEILQAERARFLATFSSVEFPLDFRVEYQPSLISEERINEYLDREIIVGHTLIGPHKDDFTVNLGELSVPTYGSRGQQRMAVLWLKMAEYSALLNHTHQRPVLLLDDIFSELDEHVRELVTTLMKQGQTLLTTADERVPAELSPQWPELQTITLSP